MVAITNSDGLVINSEVNEAQARLLNGYGAKVVSVNAELAKKAAKRRQQEQAARDRDAARKAARAGKAVLTTLA